LSILYTTTSGGPATTPAVANSSIVDEPLNECGGCHVSKFELREQATARRPCYKSRGIRRLTRLLYTNITPPHMCSKRRGSSGPKEGNGPLRPMGWMTRSILVVRRVERRGYDLGTVHGLWTICLFIMCRGDERTRENMRKAWQVICKTNPCYNDLSSPSAYIVFSAIRMRHCSSWCKLEPLNKMTITTLAVYESRGRPITPPIRWTLWSSAFLMPLSCTFRLLFVNELNELD
jgi:hypothetical protein